MINNNILVEQLEMRLKHLDTIISNARKEKEHINYVLREFMSSNDETKLYEILKNMDKWEPLEEDKVD